MEENNDIVLAGGDALAYLAEPMDKKYYTTFFWDHLLVRTYLMTDFSTPSPCTHLYTFWMTPLHAPSCVRT